MTKEELAQHWDKFWREGMNDTRKAFYEILREVEAKALKEAAQIGYDRAKEWQDAYMANGLNTSTQTIIEQSAREGEAMIIAERIRAKI